MDTLPKYSGPVCFIECEDRVQGLLDSPSFALIKWIFLEGEESYVGEFAIEILWVMGYEKDETIVHHARKNNPVITHVRLISELTKKKNWVKIWDGEKKKKQGGNLDQKQDPWKYTKIPHDTFG